MDLSESFLEFAWTTLFISRAKTRHVPTETVVIEIILYCESETLQERVENSLTLHIESHGNFD